MDNRQFQQSTSPRSGLSRGWKIAAFISTSLVILGVAILWAFNDMGWISGPYEKLALIFFTWALLETALYAAFFRGESKYNER